MMTTADLDDNGQDDVLVSFHDPHVFRVWKNNTAWEKLVGLCPELAATGDLDGNGRDEVLVDLVDLGGLWTVYNDSRWWRLLAPDPAPWPGPLACPRNESSPGRPLSAAHDAVFSEGFSDVDKERRLSGLDVDWLGESRPCVLAARRSDPGSSDEERLERLLVGWGL